MGLRNSTNDAHSKIFSSSLFARNTRKDVLSPLINLEMLQLLDLSFNSFSGVGVPHQLPALKYLQYLNLSNAGFVGKVPWELGNMSTLRHLDLSTNYYISSSSITIGGMQMWIGNLRNLEELLLDGVNMAQVTSDEWGKSTSTMYSLRRLQMSSCEFSGSIPPSLGNLTSLTYLQLGGNSFFSSIPVHLQNLSNLFSLKVSNCELNGSIPSALFSLPNLQEADLSANFDLGGDLSTILPPYSASLNSLVLAATGVTGAIPDSIGNISSLTLLDLSDCSVQDNRLRGSIPEWIWDSSALQRLNLSHNSFTGALPSKLLGPENLKVLNLHHNNLQGPLPLPPPSLVVLDLSENHFHGSIPAEIGNYKFNFLSLSHNNLSGSIPSTICEGLSMEILDISYNSLTGKIPPDFVNCNSLEVLNLEKNSLTGELPAELGNMASLQTLKIGGNRINGALPRLANCAQLQILDMGDNSLIGNISSDWILELPNLKILILRSNRLEGSVPADIGKVPCLQILDLSMNSFSGAIPESISEMKSMTNKSEITEVFEFGLIKDVKYVEKIIIRNKGLKLEYVRTLSLVKCLDLSSNRLSGHVRKGMGSLMGLIILNISRNNINGGIPKSLGDMARLESLDLSQNNLSGVIPTELQSLTFLSYLNLSYNNLTGQIPRGAQFATFEASSFSLNESRSPLPKDGSNHKIGAREEMEIDTSDVGEEVWWGLSVGLSFAFAFNVVIGILCLSKTVGRRCLQLMDRSIVYLFERFRN